MLSSQLISTKIETGAAVLSNAGRANFQGRFYPAVVGMQDTAMFVPYNDPIAVAAKTWAIIL